MDANLFAYNLLKGFSNGRKQLTKNIKLSYLHHLATTKGVSAFGLPNPGPIAQRAILDAGQSDVLSVRETNGNNAGKFVEIYLKIVGLSRGEPWCQAFVMFRLIKAATELGLTIPVDMPRSGYTPTVANWGKKKGWWISRAQAQTGAVTIMRGDLVYFYKAEKGRVAHVGIVDSVLPNGVWTIEGNTGPGAGVKADGDGVYKKFRTWDSLGLYGGFVRLPF
jgi:hypothetical protein